MASPVLAEFQYPIYERAAYLARVHDGVTIPLLALSLVPFCARLYVRVRPVWRLAWDDLFIVLGLVRSAASACLCSREKTMRAVPS
jgi:hypothetical protein